MPDLTETCNQLTVCLKGESPIHKCNIRMCIYLIDMYEIYVHVGMRATYAHPSYCYDFILISGEDDDNNLTGEIYGSIAPDIRPYMGYVAFLYGMTCYF